MKARPKSAVPQRRAISHPPSAPTLDVALRATGSECVSTLSLCAGDAEGMAFARAIERLPEGRRFAVLLAFFEQLGVVGLVPPVLSVQDDIHTMFWLEAMAEHRLGEPKRLASLLRQRGAPPPMVADYIASIAERHAPRPRGRPKQSARRSDSLHQALSELIERRAAFRKFRDRYDELRREHTRDRATGGTPSEHALATLAAERSISIAEARRRLREGKQWVDPPPRSNAVERNQSDPKWVQVTCAHCHRVTSISGPYLEVLLKIS
jgi:hypothetical protein